MVVAVQVIRSAERVADLLLGGFPLAGTELPRPDAVLRQRSAVPLIGWEVIGWEVTAG